MKNDYDKLTDMLGTLLTGVTFALCLLGAFVLLIGAASAFSY